MTGGKEEVPCLFLHARIPEPFPEHFKVPCLQHSGKLGDFLEIRVYGILPDLVGDNGLVGDQSLCLLIHPDGFGACAVLDLDLRSACFSGFLLHREISGS